MGPGDKHCEENITFENGTMKIKQTTGALRDLGPSDVIWFEIFLNYIRVKT